MISAFEYAISDEFFMVGNHVAQRLHGYPQGGSFSEPATLIDLGLDNYRFISSNKNTGNAQPQSNKILNLQGVQGGGSPLGGAMSPGMCAPCIEDSHIRGSQYRGSPI